MNNVIIIYKLPGLTPYQSILEFKKKFPEYRKEIISYAGRLDPMAEGILLLLIGKENKKRRKYENLKKTYEFSILPGIETDTYDTLGKITKHSITQTIGIKNLLSNGEEGNFGILNSFVKKRIQAYPPYSSKAVNGKPLYWWARNNRVKEIEIPTKEVEIFDLQLISSGKIEAQDLRLRIQERIKKVKGDFRQEEILKSWNQFFESTHVTSFHFISLKTTCSSGTYVRGIAHEIGQMLGCGAIALYIKRTAIGNFNISSIIKA